MKIILKIFFLALSISAYSQYAPAAGQPGSTAISADSSVFCCWATSVQIERGWINISDTTKGKASDGTPAAATGKADNSTVSLGDGGTAVVEVNGRIYNGPGWDFAIFENSFDGKFLELAFVEVSSDGQNFFRFPAHSLTQDSLQIAPFGTLDPTKIHNLAGKYKTGYGTPFDLEEMKNINGLNINNIIKIRIADVVGSIDTAFATYDTAGNIVNDPWPVNFPSSGFDLDAVGIIHLATGISGISSYGKIKIFPNPVTSQFFILESPLPNHEQFVVISDMSGREVFRKQMFSNRIKINVSNRESGVYFVSVYQANTGIISRRKIVVINP